MTELDILIHAKDYIDKLAQGIDPISGQEVPEDSVINQARLVRCFFYVSGVLQKILVTSGHRKYPIRGGSRLCSLYGGDHG